MELAYGTRLYDCPTEPSSRRDRSPAPACGPSPGALTGRSWHPATHRARSSPARPVGSARSANSDTWRRPRRRHVSSALTSRRCAACPRASCSTRWPSSAASGNLFEIVSAAYWRENYGFRQPGSVVAWAGEYLDDPVGHEHIERLARIRAEATGSDASLEEAALDLLGGSHDVVVARRHVVADARTDDQLVSSGVLTPDEHAAYIAFTVQSLVEIQQAQPHAKYIAVFQNWLRPAGASFEHLHKQLVAVDEHGPQVDRELALLSADHGLYQHAIADLAVREGLVVAATDGAVAFAGVGHRYPAFEVYSTSAANLPHEHAPEEIRAVSDVLHALHAATGVHVPTNEEWHYRPPGAPWPMPWRIVLKWRVSNPAGFEGGTKVYVNTIDPWELRRRTVVELQRLRDEGQLSPNIRIGDECTPDDARLRYAG